MAMMILDAQFPGVSEQSGALLPVLLSRIETVDLHTLFIKLKSKKIKTWKEVVEASATWKPGFHDLFGRETEEDHEAELAFDVDLRTVNMTLAVDLTPGREDLAQRFETIVTSLHDELCGRWLMGPLLDIRVSGIRYPRPRPPRLHPVWAMPVIVDFFCERFHREHPKGRLAEVEKLASAELPPGVARERKGDLLVLRWLSRPATREALRDALSKHEQILTRVLDPPRDVEFNPEGDKQVTFSAESPMPPLTSYQPDRQRGYKAVVPSGGRILDEIAAELKECVARGTIPDGRSLKKLTILVPGREDALAVAAQAHELGADQILYADATRQGVWWNPFPPGEWL